MIDDSESEEIESEKELVAINHKCLSCGNEFTTSYSYPPCKECGGGQIKSTEVFE